MSHSEAVKAMRKRVHQRKRGVSKNLEYKDTPLSVFATLSYIGNRSNNKLLDELKQRRMALEQELKHIDYTEREVRKIQRNRMKTRLKEKWEQIK